MTKEACMGVLAKSLQSCLTLATPWTVTHQAPLSMRFSRHEYWSALPCPSPGNLPDRKELPDLGPTHPSITLPCILCYKRLVLIFNMYQNYLMCFYPYHSGPKSES